MIAGFAYMLRCFQKFLRARIDTEGAPFAEIFVNDYFTRHLTHQINMIAYRRGAG
jgi:hypothetical protein